MRRITLHVTDDDRQRLDGYRFSGKHSAREVTRAHVLAALDKGLSDKQICQVLGVSRMVIWRTRSAYLDKWLEYALEDAPRSPSTNQYQLSVDSTATCLTRSQYGSSALFTAPRFDSTHRCIIRLPSSSHNTRKTLFSCRSAPQDNPL
ncbi:MAG: helix-turn-helix domain-containing protein [Verrucomicrobia bacterium]|nr:helix-turn-helix domain-containing protein [Verrucomicrobiota bacterium]